MRQGSTGCQESTDWGWERKSGRASQRRCCLSCVLKIYINQEKGRRKLWGQVEEPTISKSIQVCKDLMCT